jgi:hypothetical protein
MNVSSFGPKIRQSSTLYDFLGRQKRAIPPWCALGVFNTAAEYPLNFLSVDPICHLGFQQDPQVNTMPSITLKAVSNPPLQPLRMLYVATAINPLPSACDGMHGSVSTMGFPP